MKNNITQHPVLFSNQLPFICKIRNGIRATSYWRDEQIKLIFLDILCLNPHTASIVQIIWVTPSSEAAGRLLGHEKLLFSSIRT